MTTPGLFTTLADPGKDLLGRPRVVNPANLWASKLIGHQHNLRWDNQQLSGSGTSSSYDVDTSALTLSVSADTVGFRALQSYQWFGYQPGNTQSTICTGVLGGKEPGIRRRIGRFNGKSGIWFEQAGRTTYCVMATEALGLGVEVARVPQSGWNLNKLLSGDYVLDPTTKQLYVIEYLWQGVGVVRWGVVVGTSIVYVHQETHSNAGTDPYIVLPNLPIRYDILNDGTGPDADIKMFCTTVYSEGGYSPEGDVRGPDTDVTLSSAAAGTTYALMGIELTNPTRPDDVTVEGVRIFMPGNNVGVHWSLLLNPTVAGTFTYTPQADSHVSVASGALTNTASGGTVVGSGYSWGRDPLSEAPVTRRPLGISLAGVSDKLVLCVKILTGAPADIQGHLVWRELT